MLTTTYREGLSPLIPGHPAYASPYGALLILVCLFGGGGMLAFELHTFAREEVLIMPWLWGLRVVLYVCLAAPGLLAAPSLMPPLLPSVMLLLVALTNGVAFAARALPANDKDWAWKLLGSSKREKRKVEESGGEQVSLGDFVKALPRDTYIQARQQSMLPRYVLIVLYTTLNLYLWSEAFSRHYDSPKGRALRGEDFLGCPTVVTPPPTIGLPPVPDNPQLPPPPGGAAPIPGQPINATTSRANVVYLPCPYAGDPRGVLIAGSVVLRQVGAGRWFPFAKGCGQLLNLNCMVLILPVVRSAIKHLHDLTSLSPPWYLAWIPYIVQLDKNIVNHKAVAKYFVLASVLGHACAHYFNYGAAPYYHQELGPLAYDASPTAMAWGAVTPGSALTFPSAGLTGQLLTLVMVVIYSGAHETVRRRHYETFWYTHHLFVVWFLLLLLHGPVWWMWATPALLAYAVDRVVLRVYMRGRKRMALARVYFWGKPGKLPDVITLQFDNAVNDKGVKPLEYREGHYLYLNCPFVEQTSWACLKEWHPFTISSAPDEPVLEVNIRVMPSPLSWTNKVACYLKLFDPHNAGEVELTTRNPTTGEVTLGKVDGPDGRPLFRVDAPHGAPSQHVFRYRTCMLVGAGIGVTPCSSIMKGIVNYRWKKGFSPHHLHFYWVARMTDLSTFRWLVLVLPELKAAQLRHNRFYDEGAASSRAELQQTVQRLERELSELGPAVDAAEAAAGGGGGGRSTLPDGWEEHATVEGKPYYLNRLTNTTSWERPAAAATNQRPQQQQAAAAAAAKRAEVSQARAVLQAASSSVRELSITLFLTGCKKEDVAPVEHAEPGSIAEIVTELQKAVDPVSGAPLVRIRAGRPDWDGEFVRLREVHRQEKIGVVFCGAPPIAQALKRCCELHSDATDGTIFKLHKENF